MVVLFQPKALWLPAAFFAIPGHTSRGTGRPEHLGLLTLGIT